MSDAGRPLEGVRVLDLTNVLAGPFCCYQLALLGAEVLKVERPGEGDLARQLGADPDLNRALMGASFLAQNAGKRSLTLDLKTAEGRQILERLLRTADVLVENFRPGVMARLKLAPKDLLERHPRLIYAVISGFGQAGPLAGRPAYDQIVQGMSGLMSVTGTPETAPLRVGTPIADTVGGLTAAFAITSALTRRARTGRGGLIDVSMLEALITTMGWVVSNWLIAGWTPAAHGNDNMTASPSGTFRTADRPINLAANQQRQFERLCELIGRPELKDDPRFAEREARKRHRDALTAEIEAALVGETARHWVERLNQAGIPAGEVLSVPEVLEHPQVVGRGLVHRFDVPWVERAVSVLSAGFRLDDHALAATCPPPALGADTEAVLEELGYGPEDIRRLREKGVI
ncbi:MAG: CaiB/BaiF CoA-transferase family protein [Geminicoccaceae bacterium]|nr:CaiB/BaiF CoA-transferase family protein [Geminicoccaceae bacterium]